MSAKIAIYTAIFGDRGRDELLSQKVLPANCDYIVFTDRPLKSDVWQVRQVSRPLPDDPVRSARMYKTLPHRYLGSYECSIWIDCYIQVQKDVNELINTYLQDTDIAIYDHSKLPDARDCVYDELDALVALADTGNHKDDPDTMKAQVERYRQEGYPAHNGLISSMVVLRRHNEQKVIEAMEAWWNEIRKGSRRDQLSFNYAAWKHNLPLTYLPDDSRHNEYFEYLTPKQVMIENIKHTLTHLI